MDAPVIKTYSKMKPLDVFKKSHTLVPKYPEPGEHPHVRESRLHDKTLEVDIYQDAFDKLVTGSKAQANIQNQQNDSPGNDDVFFKKPSSHQPKWKKKYEKMYQPSVDKYLNSWESKSDEKVPSKKRKNPVSSEDVDKNQNNENQTSLNVKKVKKSGQSKKKANKKRKVELSEEKVEPEKNGTPDPSPDDGIPNLRVNGVEHDGSELAASSEEEVLKCSDKLKPLKEIPRLQHLEVSNALPCSTPRDHRLKMVVDMQHLSPITLDKENDTFNDTHVKSLPADNSNEHFKKKFTMKGLNLNNEIYSAMKDGADDVESESSGVSSNKILVSEKSANSEVKDDDQKYKLMEVDAPEQNHLETSELLSANVACKRIDNGYANERGNSLDPAVLDFSINTNQKSQKSLPQENESTRKTTFCESPLIFDDTQKMQSNKNEDIDTTVEKVDGMPIGPSPVSEALPVVDNVSQSIIFSTEPKNKGASSFVTHNESSFTPDDWTNDYESTYAYGSQEKTEESVIASDLQQDHAARQSSDSSAIFSRSVEMKSDDQLLISTNFITLRENKVTHSVDSTTEMKEPNQSEDVHSSQGESLIDVENSSQEDSMVDVENLSHIKENSMDDSVQILNNDEELVSVRTEDTSEELESCNDNLCVDQEQASPHGSLEMSKEPTLLTDQSLLVDESKAVETGSESLSLSNNEDKISRQENIDHDDQENESIAKLKETSVSKEVQEDKADEHLAVIGTMNDEASSSERIDDLSSLAESIKFNYQNDDTSAIKENTQKSQVAKTHLTDEDSPASSDSVLVPPANQEGSQQYSRKRLIEDPCDDFVTRKKQKLSDSDVESQKVSLFQDKGHDSEEKVGPVDEKDSRLNGQILLLKLVRVTDEDINRLYPSDKPLPKKRTKRDRRAKNKPRTVNTEEVKPRRGRPPNLRKKVLEAQTKHSARGRNSRRSLIEEVDEETRRKYDLKDLSVSLEDLDLESLGIQSPILSKGRAKQRSKNTSLKSKDLSISIKEVTFTKNTINDSSLNVNDDGNIDENSCADNHDKSLNVSNEVGKAVGEDSSKDESLCAFLSQLNDPVRITMKRNMTRKWERPLAAITEDNVEEQDDINPEEEKENEEDVPEKMEVVADESSDKDENPSNDLPNKNEDNDVAEAPKNQANNNSADNDLAEAPKSQAIFLKPGKSWARSLSIINHLHSGQNLDDLAAGRSQNWRHSAQTILDMQSEGNTRNTGTIAEETEPQPNLQAQPSDQQTEFIRPSSILLSPSKLSQRPSVRPSVRIVPDTERSTLTGDFANLRKSSFITDRSRKTSIARKTSFIIRRDTLADSEEDLIQSAKEIILKRCNQTSYLPFEVCFPDSYINHCRKIGEGVYGEVFLYKKGSEQSVIKIIPIEGNEVVNCEPQKKFHEILSEIIIAEELHKLRFGSKYNTNGFVGVNKIRCVTGKYPEKLIKLWSKFDKEKKSENDCPSMFNDEQLYIILELAHGGQDLEAFTFDNASESYSIFLQTAFSLAVAEQCLEFEHRDLHWGNILISETDEASSQYVLGDHNVSIATKGVKVSVIDFTLSRMSYQGCKIFNDLAADPTLFTAQGEYQFDIYRMMKDTVDNDWQQFNPFTNILWLDYTLEKMINAVRYKKKRTKVHKAAIEEMKELREEIMNYKSAFDFVVNCKIINTT